MKALKNLNKFVAFGCVGLAFVGLVACSDDESASRADPIIVGDDDEPIVINPDTGDSSKQKIDTTHHIDPVTGDTIIKIDTILIPLDTTMHWVGNSALVITEVTPVNLNWTDETGRDPGWVEIYNAGTEAANLKGYALIETLDKGRKWVFGDELIAAKSFRTVFCDKKNLTTAPDDTDFGVGRTHTNWKLEKDGGTLYLVDPYFGIRDSVKYPELASGVSWGIVDGGSWRYFAKPTPEKPNNVETAYDGMAPEFSFNGSQGGFYSDPVVLNAPSVSGGLKVRCTQNGSIPTKDSPEFNQTITIDKNTVLRCAAFKDGLLTKKTVTNTYFIDEQVNMPVVAVSVDSAFFRENYLTDLSCQDPKTCPSGLMADVEYPVHVEYFPKGSKSASKAWEIDAGISLMGNWSRVKDKKSVAITMREEYEDGWLKPPADAPLFETRKDVNNKFKGFNLRNNGNRFVSDYFEDPMGGALLEGSGVDYQRSRQVVVFYNGKYYGIHDMRERYNKNYVETNYDIDASTVGIIKQLGDLSDVSANTQEAYDNYAAMLQFIGTNDFSGANNENYAAVKGLMDVGNYADYMIAEIYYHNGDWPNNNVRAWYAPDHPWKFMVYDIDHGFGWKWGVNSGEFGDGTNMFSWIKKGGGNKPCKETGCFANIYIKLIKNPDFLRLFLQHAAVMHEHYLNAENVKKVSAEMAASLDADEMTRDLEKFKQNEQGYGSFSKSGSVFVEWAQERDSDIVSEYAAEFGVSNMVKMTIGANGKGTVLMEGMKLPGKGSSYTGKFYAGVGMELTAVPEAGAVFAGWSDGSTENPHLIATDSDASITATFK